jgi:hypothetical protein
MPTSERPNTPPNSSSSLHRAPPNPTLWELQSPPHHIFFSTPSSTLALAQAYSICHQARPYTHHTHKKTLNPGSSVPLEETITSNVVLARNFSENRVSELLEVLFMKTDPSQTQLFPDTSIFLTSYISTDPFITGCRSLWVSRSQSEGRGHVRG